MKKILVVTVALTFFLSLAFELKGQEVTSEEPFYLSFHLGLQVEIFKRSVVWDEAEKISPLNAYFTALRLEAQVAQGPLISLIAGYSSSNFQELVFRRLPFSIDFEGGGLAGSLFGAELSQIFNFNSLSLGGRARFLSYAGQEKKWLVPELAVEGELKSLPNWKQIALGPIFGYNGYENFFPYLSVQYNHHWGNFKLRQIIENLTGEETKEMKAKSKLAFSLGANFSFSSRLSVAGEATLLPCQGGPDWSLNVRGTFSF